MNFFPIPMLIALWDACYFSTFNIEYARDYMEAWLTIKGYL